MREMQRRGLCTRAGLAIEVLKLRRRRDDMCEVAILRRVVWWCSMVVIGRTE